MESESIQPSTSTWHRGKRTASRKQTNTARAGLEQGCATKRTTRTLQRTTNATPFTSDGQQHSQECQPRTKQTAQSPPQPQPSVPRPRRIRGTCKPFREEKFRPQEGREVEFPARAPAPTVSHLRQNEPRLGMQPITTWLVNSRGSFGVCLVWRACLSCAAAGRRWCRGSCWLLADRFRAHLPFTRKECRESLPVSNVSTVYGSCPLGQLLFHPLWLLPLQMQQSLPRQQHEQMTTIVCSVSSSGLVAEEDTPPPPYKLKFAADPCAISQRPCPFVSNQQHTSGFIIY